MSALEQIVVTGCPTCGAPAQAIAEGEGVRYRRVDTATLKAAQGGVTEAMVEDKAREMYEAYRSANPDARMHPWEWQPFNPTLDHWRLKARAALEAAPPAEPAERVPEGYVLVPAEAGDADAFMVLYEYQQPGRTRKDAYRIAIRKLAERAAPAPSEGGKEVEFCSVCHKPFGPTETRVGTGDGTMRANNGRGSFAHRHCYDTTPGAAHDRP